MSTLADRWRFALQRRWFVYLGLAVAFAIACGFLSHWQFGRNAETIAENSLVSANYAAKPVPVSTLLPTKTSFSSTTIYRRVTLTGSYLVSKQLLVRDRSLGSNPGFEVLTPFRETNGNILVIDRGWVAVGTKHSYPDFIPAAPAGQETVVARLQGSEAVLAGRSSPKGQIAEINLPAVAQAARLSNTYVGAYGLLVSETPKPAERPTPLPRPVIDNGPYLSYAYQWILFAIMAFGGLTWALRQEYRKVNADDPVVREQAAERLRKARLRNPTDADIEDAQIAQAVAEGSRREMIDAG